MGEGPLKGKSRKKDAEKTASKVKLPVAYGTVGKTNGSFGAAVTSPDAYAASGEAKSVTCHGFTRG